MQRPIAEYGPEGAGPPGSSPQNSQDEEVDDDEGFDLFGDDDDEEEVSLRWKGYVHPLLIAYWQEAAAEKLKQERVAAYTEKKSKSKLSVASCVIVYCTFRTCSGGQVQYHSRCQTLG